MSPLPTELFSSLCLPQFRPSANSSRDITLQQQSLLWPPKLDQIFLRGFRPLLYYISLLHSTNHYSCDFTFVCILTWLASFPLWTTSSMKDDVYYESTFVSPIHSTEHGVQISMSQWTCWMNEWMHKINFSYTKCYWQHSIYESIASWRTQQNVSNFHSTM